MIRQEIITLFKNRAQAAAAEILPCRTWSGAADKVLSLLKSSSPRIDLLSGLPASDKSIAMPGLPLALAQIISQRLPAKTLLVNDNLKNYIGGLDLGLVVAQAGLAESGSCLVDCSNREIRLASMLPEISIILLREADIVANLSDLAPTLRKNLENSNHLTMITGPSRTADIERVLTLGAHGPARLVILLFPDWPQE